MAETTKQKIDRLSEDLRRATTSEDLDDEMMRDEFEGTIPLLLDALAEAGYGITYYKIWSEEHRAWWKPGRGGYTQDRKEAGIYTEAEAREIVESANFGLKDVPNEAMVELVADEPGVI